MVPAPSVTGKLGEWNRKRDARLDPQKDPVIARLSQFGFDMKIIERDFNKKIIDLTPEEYDSLIVEAIKGWYDVVVASVFDKYVCSPEQAPDNSTRLQNILKLIERFEGIDAKMGINLVKKASDLKNQANVILGLEAGDHLIESVNDANVLVKKGIKLFGIQYKIGTVGADETSLASYNSGLTKLSNEVVKSLLKQGIMIDLAHASHKTRIDVRNIAKSVGAEDLIAYTHGCHEDDIVEHRQGTMGERALKRGELEEIIKKGGIIGLAVTQPFSKNVRALAERIDRTIQTTGNVNGLAIGSDFGGVSPKSLNEIKSVADYRILADLLSEEFRIDDDQIEKILRYNARNWIESALKKSY
jgi:membrane dipeptidase